MLKLIKNRSDFIKNISKLVAGTAAAQAISFLAAPVITRLYTPSDIGAFTFLISVAGCIVIVSTLRYEMAIVLSKDRKDSINLASLSLTIALGFAVLIACVLFFSDLFNVFGFTKSLVYRRWIYLLPFLVFMMAAGNVFQLWFNDKREYKTLAYSKIISSGVNNSITLIIGFAGFGALGLWLGNFAGFLAIILFFIIIFRVRYREELSHIKISLQKSLARTYKYLPMANTPQVIVELVQLYGIIFLIQAFFSSEVLGWYSLSQRLLQAPMNLIGASICQVYFKEASEKYALDGSIMGLLKKTIRMSALVALPVLIVMLTIGPWLISFIFGLSWRESGVISRILAPWFFFDFIRATISYTPLIIGKTRQMFYVSMFGSLLIVLSLTIGGLLFRNAFSAFILFSAVLSCYCIGVIAWIFSCLKRKAH